MHRPYLSVNIKGRLLDFNVPKVMAIVNVTPDSFYAESRAVNKNELRARFKKILDEGADIIDVGACSTRPGANDISASEELERLTPALDLLREMAPDAVLSVDTWRADVAEKCITQWNADIINDISGGRDPRMFDTVAERKVCYVLTHSRGVPADMQSHMNYSDVTAQVISELVKKAEILRLKKVSDIIIDPGFGFAKSPRQSLQLLDELDAFCRLGMPVLAALSRKSMIWKTLGVTPQESLEATVALDAIALDRGADIIRVHDVKAAVQTVKLLVAMKEGPTTVC